MSAKLDSSASLNDHAARIRANRFLNRLYADFYRLILSVPRPAGPVVELGSGAGFLKEILPSVITSDVVGGLGIDEVFFAEKIPFNDASVAGYLMYDVFHHIKDPAAALGEMSRTLISGGKIIMIEPYNSWWGRFIYTHFHHEDFNPSAGWKIIGEGRLSDANGASPWIVFVRDRVIFHNKFPEFRLVDVTPHTPLAYICSGGLSKPQLLPGFLYPLVRAVEFILQPFNRWLGMFVTIVVEKR